MITPHRFQFWVKIKVRETRLLTGSVHFFRYHFTLTKAQEIVVYNTCGNKMAVKPQVSFFAYPTIPSPHHHMLWPSSNFLDALINARILVHDRNLISSLCSSSAAKILGLSHLKAAECSRKWIAGLKDLPQSLSNLDAFWACIDLSELPPSGSGTLF